MSVFQSRGILIRQRSRGDLSLESVPGWAKPGDSLVCSPGIWVCVQSLSLNFSSSTGEGNGNPLQYSCLGNPMDRGAWQATVPGVQRVGHDLAIKQQQLKTGPWTFHLWFGGQFHYLWNEALLEMGTTRHCWWRWEWPFWRATNLGTSNRTESHPNQNQQVPLDAFYLGKALCVCVCVCVW